MLYRKFSGWVVRIVQRAVHAPGAGLAQGRAAAQVEDNLAWSHKPDHELRHDLALAVDSLPPICRDALLMRDFEELTIEEMGERLGVTREAAKSRLHRALALVREYLQPAQRLQKSQNL